MWLDEIILQLPEMQCKSDENGGKGAKIFARINMLQNMF